MEPLTYQFADPNAAILNGIKTGAVVSQLDQQRQMQALALQQAGQQQADLRSLAMNPNAGHADYASLMTKYPALAEHLGKAVKVMDEGQQQNLVNFQSRVYAAQLSGNNELAASLLEDRAKADPAQAQHYATMADLIRKSPATARTVSALGLAGAMGPDKFATAFTNLGTEARAAEQAPADLLKKQADAATAVSTAGIKGVEAQNAPTATVLANEKDRQTILSAEAQRQVANFNAQIAAANSETQRGQLTLERDKFVAEQGKKTQAAGQDAQDQFDTITQGLDSVKSLQKYLSAEGWFGRWNGVGTTTGKLMAYIPGSDAKDFRATLDTLKAQQFLAQSQKMKGLGALTEIEGAKIEKAVASLDPEMTPQAFKTALTTIERQLEKGHAKLVARGQLPTTGGAFAMRHPVYGNVTDSDITRLMSQNPGATREQVMEYLRSTGGK